MLRAAHLLSDTIFEFPVSPVPSARISRTPQVGTILVEVLVQELWSNQSAYDPHVYGHKLHKMREAVLRPRGVSAELSGLAMRCLQWSPDDRPSASEIYPVLYEL